MTKFIDKAVLWFGLPAAWDRLFILNLGVATGCAIMMISAEPRWLALVDASLFGFNLALAINARMMRGMRRSVDEARDLFNAMVRLNNDLINAKIEAVIFRDDDGAPIAPDTRH